MRKSVIALIIAALSILWTPCVWALGHSSHNGSVSVSKIGEGTVYLSTSGNATTGDASATWSCAGESSKDSKTFYLYAKPSAGWDFVGWSGSGTSSDNPYKATLNAQNGEHAFTATFAELYKLSFQATENGTYTVTDGASAISETSEAKTLSTAKEVTMTATPAAGFTVKEWWYQEEGGSRVSLGNEKSYKHTFGSDATVGVAFMAKGETIVNKTTGEKFFGLAAAVEAVNSGETLELLDDEDLAADVTLPTGVSLVVPQQKTLTIPQGVVLSNSGTIMLSGVILNSGKIAGSGTLAKNYATVTQESTIHVPFPYGTDGKEVGQGVADVDGTAGKYVVTSTVTTDHTKSKIGSCSCDVRWYIAVNTAAGESFMSGMTTDEPVGVLCKVNRKIALNWITSVGDAYTKITIGTAATDMSPKMGYENNYKDGDGLFVLVRDASPAIGGQSSVFAYGAFDCAGHTLSFSEYQFNGSYILRFFNGVGKIAASNHVMNIHVMFYNCKKGSAATKMSLNNTGYLSSVSLYDSPDVSVSWSGSKAGNGVKYNIYGGGPYNPTYQKFSHVYWGTFVADKNPTNPTQYLADSTHYTVLQKADKTWEVVRKEPDPDAKAARIDGVEYATLDLALKAATGGQRIEVLKDIVLQEDLVVGSATDATLDLSGYSISGSFALENHGVLEIVDDSGCVTPSDVTVNIVNKAGHLYLGAATYSGTITLDGGKCDLLSGSYKNEVCVGADVRNPSDVLEITLGKFAEATYRHGTEHLALVDLIPHGHVRSDNGVYHIGKIPMAYVTGSSQSYSIKAFGTTDEENLYGKTLESTRRSAYNSRETWIRAMEMDAGRDLVGSYSIDCTMVFDRDVAANTVAGSSFGMELPLKEFAAANVVKSVLLPGIRDSNATERAPWSYGQFMPGGEHSSISLKVTSEDCNVGTTCRLQMRYAPHVRWQSGGRQYDYDMSQSAVAAECVFVFGAGSNVAMIQKTGGADFYDNVQDAVDAVVSEGTVKLCNDVLDAVVVKVSKPCTIDLNGFAFKGSFEAPAGYEMVRTGDVVTFESTSVAITIDDVENMEKVVAVDGETIEAEDGNAFLVPVGSDVVVTYTAKPGYVGGPITKTVENVQNGDRIEATAEDNAVAKLAVAQLTVGETTTKYASLADAVKAIETEGSVTLLADIDLGSACVTVPAAKAMTLDLNGKTLTSAASQTISVSGALTIKDGATGGKIVNTKSSGKAVSGTNGTVTLLSGTLEAPENAISAKTVHVEGGMAKANKIAVSGAGTISGGTLVSATSYAAYASGSGATLEITGGTLTGAAAKGDVGVYTGNVLVKDVELANGIRFTANATGLILPETDEGLFTPELGIYDGEALLGYAPAQTSGTVAAMEGKTVKLLRDCSTTDYLTIGKGCTFDLNGHNLASSGAVAILVKAATAATPSVVTISGSGTVSANNAKGCNAVQVGSYATLTIEGGTFVVPGDNSTVYVVSSYATQPSTVTITGGSFASGDGRYVLNIKDDQIAKGAAISVSGGSFTGFNPEDNAAEGEHTNFVADGYMAVESEEGVWTVVEALALEIPSVANAAVVVKVNGEVVEPVDGKVSAPIGATVEVVYSAVDGWQNDTTVTIDAVTSGSKIEVGDYAPVRLVAQVGGEKFTSLDAAVDAARSSGEPILVLGAAPETAPEGFASIAVNGKTLLVPETEPEVVVLAPDTETFTVTAKDEDGQSIAVPAGADAVATAAQEKVAAAGTAVVFEGTGVLDEEVCPLDAVVAALQAAEGVTEAERAQITAASEIRRYVSVQLTAVEVTAAAAFAGLSFDVKPMAKTFVIGADGAVKVVVAQIPNTELKGGITFRLPLMDVFTASARIVHEHDADRLVRVEVADGKRYVTVTATHFSIFTAYPDSHVESALTASNVLAVKRVPGIDGAAAGTEVVAAVPWKNVALTDDVTADRLIATGVATGDEIAAWMDGEKTYYTWRWNGTAWEPATDAKTNVTAPAANATTLLRGMAVWYKRANPSAAYSQVGGYDPATVTTTVTQGGATSANKPANTLLINPYDEAVDLAKIPGASGDQIQVISTLKVYTNKNGQWGTLQLVETPSPFGVPMKKQQFVAATEPIVLPAGQGFWYISKGGQLTIDWKALAPSSAAPQE